MSGDLDRADSTVAHDPADEATPATPPCVEVTDAREAMVGTMPVRRLLPRRARRTVGAWCFVDHMGPTTSDGPGIGPHPHIGLHTVTWMLEGELLHIDSLGYEQVIRPGQLNLMTAGDGVAHAEEMTSQGSPHHGVQLWVAQPESTRHGEPDFAHHAELPRIDLPGVDLTLMIGSLDGHSSPVRADTPLIGVDVAATAGTAPTIGLDPGFEHAVVVMEGRVVVDGTDVTPGHLAYLGRGRDELRLDVPDGARAMLIGGEPFEATPLMWWNYVARDWSEVASAHDDWEAGSERFGTVASAIDRIPSIAPLHRS